MANEICPWWMGPLLTCPLRKLLQNPDVLLREFVKEGMLVLEPGPGMGFFTLPMARMVGENGRVVAVDIQAEMLAGLNRRARRAGLERQIETRLAKESGLGVEDLSGKVDFLPALAVVHELPSVEGFFAEAAEVVRPGGRLLLGEPAGHVSDAFFAAELDAARNVGFRVMAGPKVRRVLTAVMERES